MSKKKRKSKGGTRYNVSAEKFVQVWQQASSVSEVMSKLDMPRNAVYSRANSYRAKKVKLKKMPRTGPVLDIDKLNKLADASVTTSNK